MTRVLENKKHTIRRNKTFLTTGVLKIEIQFKLIFLKNIYCKPEIYKQKRQKSRMSGRGK